MDKLVELINEAKTKHKSETFAEGERNSDLWYKTTSEKADLQKSWKPRFSEMKNEVKMLFQTRYQLIFR